MSGEDGRVMKKYWVGGAGPFLIVEGEQYPGETVDVVALRTEGNIRIEGTPTDPEHAARMDDVIDTIIELTDCPASYTGQGGKVLAVKMTEDGMEFVDAGLVEEALIVYPDSSNGDLYVCKAALGSDKDNAVWKICRVQTSPSIVKTWADGNNNYDNVASDLATVKALTYS